MLFEITIESSGERFSCASDENVLWAMERQGYRGIPIGCRGGGCGVCRVQICGDTKYRTQKMGRAQITGSDEANGGCLACRLIPMSDLVVKPWGDSWVRRDVARIGTKRGVQRGQTGR